MTDKPSAGQDFDAWDPKNIEALVQKGVFEIEVRLKILGDLIKEARDAGDPVWLDLSENQAEPLMHARALAIERARAAIHEAPPEAQVIHAKVASLAAKGEVARG